MKLVISALAAVLVTAPLVAQTTPLPAPTAPVTASGKLTIDTPIETLVANPKAKAVLDKDIPGMTSHPMYEMFKSLTLPALQPQSQGQITEAQVAAVKADLGAIK